MLRNLSRYKTMLRSGSTAHSLKRLHQTHALVPIKPLIDHFSEALLEEGPNALHYFNEAAKLAEKGQSVPIRKTIQNTLGRNLSYPQLYSMTDNLTKMQDFSWQHLRQVDRPQFQNSEEFKIILND